MEVVPAGAWGRPGRWSRLRGRVWSIDDLVVRTGFPLHFEPLGTGRRPAGGACAGSKPGAAFVVTLDRLGEERPLSVDRRPAGPRPTRRRPGAAGWRPLVYDGPVPGRGGAQPAGRALLDRLRRGAGRGRHHVAAAPHRQRAQRPTTAGSAGATSPPPPATWAAAGFPEDAEAGRELAAPGGGQTPLPWPAALDADGQPVPGAGGAGPGRVAAVPARSWSAGRRGPRPRPVRRRGRRLRGLSTSGPGTGSGPGPLSAAWPALAAAVDWAGDHWGEPDAGVWESAGPPALLVASRVQVWSALDRMARLGRAANPLDLQAAAWHQEARGSWPGWRPTGRPRLHRRAAACAAPDRPAPGTNPTPPCCVSPGAAPGPGPSDRGRHRRSGPRTAGLRPSLVYRYPPQVDDGRAGPDNPDLLASLWAVRALARLGGWEEAHARMEAVVAPGGRPGAAGRGRRPGVGRAHGKPAGDRRAPGPGRRRPGPVGGAGLSRPGGRPPSWPRGRAPAGPSSNSRRHGELSARWRTLGVSGGQIGPPSRAETRQTRRELRPARRPNPRRRKSGRDQEGLVGFLGRKAGGPPWPPS